MQHTLPVWPLCSDGVRLLDLLDALACACTQVAAAELQKLGGTERGPVSGDAVPAWDDPEFAYTGRVGESEP
eukprot:COSAG02_NODE_28_length_51367_cov_70.053932_30_plen_72_part_00